MGLSTASFASFFSSPAPASSSFRTQIGSKDNSSNAGNGTLDARVLPLFNAFVNDVVPRPVLGRFFGMFRAISLTVGIIFQGSLFGQMDTSFAPIFIGIALVYGVGITLMCFFVKEGTYPPPPPIDPGVSNSRMAATTTYLRDCFSKSYYRWIFALLLVSTFAFLPINTFNYFYAKSVGMTDDTYGKLMALYFFISLIQTLPLGWLVDKFHPLRVGMAALILHGAASFYGGFFIHDQFSFGIAYVLTGTLSGTWFTATAALTMNLFPKMKFAQYSSAVGIVVSIAVMIFGPLSGYLLDLLGNPYRFTYMAGFAFDAMALAICVVVYRNYLACGGPSGYVAPE